MSDRLRLVVACLLLLLMSACGPAVATVQQQDEPAPAHVPAPEAQPGVVVDPSHHTPVSELVVRAIPPKSPVGPLSAAAVVESPDSEPVEGVRPAQGAATVRTAAPGESSTTPDPAPKTGAPAGPGPVTTLHMAPEGSGDGSSPLSPVGSFERAQQRVADLGAGNVDIVVADGTYRAGPSTWWHPLDGHRLRIVPADGADPVFVGGGASGYWLDISPRGGGGSVEVRGMTVTGYANGLRISGGYDNKSGSQVRTGQPIDRPMVTGMTFDRIGSAHASGNGYAAIHLQVANGATVTGNTFERVENGGQRASYIHAVYAVGATDMRVSDSTFTAISGDPVRVRHATSGSVHGNTFERAGRYGAVTDWFCDGACARRSAQAAECPSPGVHVEANTVRSGYGGGSVPTWAVTVPYSGAPTMC